VAAMENVRRKTSGQMSVSPSVGQLYYL